ncbi:Protein Ycf2 [Bienertia sinuspersici]
MIKRMSFKRMIRSSCRVEPSTLFPIQRSAFVSVFSHREFFADEEIAKGLLTSKRILLYLYFNAVLSRIRKKSTLNC